MSDSEPTERECFRRLGWALVLSVLAATFGGNVDRIVPGGPFVSYTGDILPFVAALAAIRLCLLLLRVRGFASKPLALAPILFATVAMANVIRGIVQFWFRPHARGDFFGW